MKTPIVLPGRPTLLFHAVIATLALGISGCGVRDQEQCKSRAAKDAKNVLALQILIEDCIQRFPGVHLLDGTYAYFDPQTRSWVGVSGAKLSKIDIAEIGKRRRMSEENLAKEDNEKIIRRRRALAGIRISYNIECNGPTPSIGCYDKNITVNVRNMSDVDVSRLEVSYDIGRGVSCAGALGKHFSRSISIPAGGEGSFVQNVKFDDAGAQGSLVGCVKVEAAE